MDNNAYVIAKLLNLMIEVVDFTGKLHEMVENSEEEISGLQKYNYEKVGQSFIDLYRELFETKENEISWDIGLVLELSKVFKILIFDDVTKESAEYWDGIFNVPEILGNIAWEIDEEKRITLGQYFINKATLQMGFNRGENLRSTLTEDLGEWNIVDPKTVGYYLDDTVQHHFGVRIPYQFVKLLNLEIDISEQKSEVPIELFFKKKIYSGFIEFIEGRYYITWYNDLRRRINKKYPKHFPYENDEVNQINTRIFMSFRTDEYFDKNYLKIDFKEVPKTNIV